MAVAVASGPSAPELAADDRGPVILATCITFTVVSTIFVAARLFTRTRIIGGLHIEDYLIILALMCGWATVGITVKSVQYGNGRHASTLTEEEMSGAIFWTVVGFCPGIMSFGLPKLAVAALLTRLMNPTRWHAIFIWSIAIFCLLSLFGCVAIFFAQCTPTQAMWDPTIEGKCFSPWVLVDYTLFAGSFSAFVDLYFAVYPAVVLFSLTFMSLKKRIGLACALGMGSVATVVAIYKTVHLPALASPDFTYDASLLTIWTTVEGSTITIAACIPLLKPMLDCILGRQSILSQKYQKYGDSHSGRKRPAAIELSDTPHGCSRFPTRKRDGAQTTITEDLGVDNDLEAAHDTNRGSDGNCSQANILSTTPPASPISLSGGIWRTDVITITETTPSEAGREAYTANGWD